jgi:L-alanine-DL-glutamate epimerase-like enolase superfamily enzyme
VRLASVEVIPYALPFREPYVTARGRLEQREMVLLRLRDEDGLVGLGEAVPLSLRGADRAAGPPQPRRSGSGRRADVFSTAIREQ